MDKSVAVAEMGLHAAEESLFKRWSAVRTSFVPDGVVDEDVYSASTLKVLFLLKEANRPDGDDLDLRDFIHDGARPQTWDVVARWMLSIRRLQEDLPWGEIASISNSQREDALRSVAVMNLKKEPGGHTTDNARFRVAVKRDQIFLREQFALYRADIVVCCGSVVSEAFRTFIYLDTQRDWPTTRRGVKFCEYEAGKHVFDYSHPEARVAHSILHYGLIDAVREVRHPSK